MIISLLKPELLLPLIVFCATTLFTPGPNNVMLMTSGLNFGLNKSLQHIFGVAFGFSFLVFCSGLGLGALFTLYPPLYNILKFAGAAYLLYLAWLIASADPTVVKPAAGKKPLNFWQAAAFQWINPKAWIMAVGAFTAYAGIATYPLNIILIAGIFCVLGQGSSFGWAGFGLVLQRLLKKPKIVRAFNIIMAILLVASIYPVLID